MPHGLKLGVTLAVLCATATGCKSHQTASEEGRPELAGGDWLGPSTAAPAIPPPDRAEGLHGIPPLWFYEKDPDGWLAIPILASFHSDQFHFWFLGVANLGWTSDGPVKEGSEDGYETVDWDLNLAGIYNSSYARVRTPSRVVETRRHRLLWFLPIFTEETTKTTSGTVVRKWLFGLISMN